MTIHIGTTHDDMDDAVEVDVEDDRVEVSEINQDGEDVYTSYTAVQARTLAALLIEAARVAESLR